MKIKKNIPKLGSEHRKNGITHNHDLEMKVLGILLLYGENVYADIHNILKPELFDHEAHKIIFTEIKKQFDNGASVTKFFIECNLYKTEIKKYIDCSHGYYLGLLIDSAEYYTRFRELCLKLVELYVERELLIIRFCQNDGDGISQMYEMKQSIDDLLQVGKTDDWQDVSEVSNNLVARIEDVYKNKATIFAHTGIRFIDNVNNGFKKRQFIILASRPGVGKSALAGKIIIKVAKQGKKVGIINLEMDNEDILSRMISDQSDIENYKFEQGLVMRDESQKTLMLKTLSDMSGLPIKFSSETKVNINDIRAKALKLHKKEGLDFLVIDYIQLINGADKSTNREQQVAAMSRGIKLLAMELGIPILAMAQLNRQGHGAENLRESGALEQDADVVMILDRNFEEVILVNDRKVTKAELKIKKWRNASTGQQEMYYDGSRLKFTNIEDAEEIGRNGQPYTAPAKTLWNEGLPYETSPNEILFEPDTEPPF